MCERIYEHVASSVAVDPITSLTLVLAALAVLLTALAIIIGVAAIWGYAGIREDARRIATEAAHKKLVEYFEKETLRDTVREMVTTHPRPRILEAEDVQPETTTGIYTGEEDKGHGTDDNESETH